MNANAKLFAKDGQTVWISKSGEVISSCVETTLESLDMNTGFIREEKLMFWVKANSEEVVEKNAKNIINNINSGKIVAYRAFSTAPFSSGDTKDINPSTNEVLERYSQVRLCPASQFETLHRQFVVNKVAVVTPENITV